MYKIKSTLYLVIIDTLENSIFKVFYSYNTCAFSLHLTPLESRGRKMRILTKRCDSIP